MHPECPPQCVPAARKPDMGPNRVTRAFTVGAGKELAAQFTRDGGTSAPKSDLWSTDTKIRGYNLGGWQGMGDALVANVAVAGTAIAADQLEKTLREAKMFKLGKDKDAPKVNVMEFLTEKMDGQYRNKYNKIDKKREARVRAVPAAPFDANWHSPGVNVLNNVEDTIFDWGIAQGADAAVNAIVQKDGTTPQKVDYVSPLSYMVSDGTNMMVYAATDGAKYNASRNIVNPGSVESAFRTINVVPVVGALFEKYVYSGLNTALVKSKLAQFVSGWSLKSLLWYVLGQWKNGEMRQGMVSIDENFTLKPKP